MTNTMSELLTPLEAAREAISPVLDLLGIRRVLSVDDEHVLSEGDSGYDPDLIVAQMQSGSLPIRQLIGDPVLHSVFVDDDGLVVDQDTAVDLVRRGLPLAVRSRLVELSVLAGTEDATPGVVDREDVDDVSSRPALEVIFRNHGYQGITLAEWTASGRKSLDDGIPTLVLVDRDFSREDASEHAGDQLVAQLLSRADAGHIRCCLLTHSAVTDQDEEQLEEQITSANDISEGALVVLSKSQLASDPARFAVRLLGVLFRHHLGTLRGLLHTAIDAGQSAARHLLEDLSPFQLLAMFAAAIREGVHEPEHMLRPLLAVSRRAMSEAVRPSRGNEDTLAPIHEALALRAGSIGLRQDDISDIQRVEMFDPIEFLNRTAAPVEPGDIFQIVNASQVLAGNAPASKYHVVLLAQPCDVMVRCDGRRGRNVPPHWALARVKSFDATQKDRPENVYLPSFLDGKPRFVKLAEIVHFPVIALDMCVLDPDGYSRLRVGQPAPPNASWSWTKRHEILSGVIEDIVVKARSANYGRLRPTSSSLVAKGLTGCLSAPDTVPEEQALSVDISVRDRRVAFGLRRVGRLNDSATRALLVQATHHQGRPASEAVLVANPVGLSDL